MIVQKNEPGDSDVVNDVKVDYYGQRLATASSDTTVKIMGLSNNSPPQKLATLTGHQTPVLQVAWAHPNFGSILASCSCDGRVIIWKESNQNKWVQTQVFHEHKGSVNCMWWAPHELGLCLACGSSDGSISVLTARSDGCWDSTRIDQAHPDGVTSLSWAPAIAPGALAGSGLLGPVHKLASGGRDNTVRVWKLDSRTWKLVGFPSLDTDSNSVQHEVSVPNTKSRVQASDDDANPGECRRNRWLFEEDELLITTWLHIPMDPIGVNDQKMVSFWKRLGKLYEENRQGGITRTWRQLKQRWHRMIREVKIFMKCHKKATQESPTEMGEKEIIAEAHRQYSSQNDGRRFVFEHSWMLLKDEPKWKAYVNMLRAEGSFKRTKAFEAGVCTSSSNPDTLTSVDVGSSEVRDIQPMSKPSKSKRKLDDNGKSNDVLAEELHEIKSAELKKAAAVEELAKTKQMEIDMQIIYKDTCSMNLDQLQFHVQLVERLKRKYLM